MLQIAMMLISSGSEVMDIKLVDLKAKYWPVYLMLLIWFGLSVLSTDKMSEQIIACTRFSVTAIFALWVTERYSVEKFEMLVFYAIACMTAVTFVSFIMFPQLCYSYETGLRTFCGLCMTKNNCAAELSFGIAFQMLVWKAKHSKGEKCSILFFGVLGIQCLLILKCSATGALFCGVLTAAYVIICGSKKFPFRPPLGWFHLVVNIGFLIVAMTVLPLFAPFFETIGKDVTITGRTPLWERLIDVMMEHRTFNGFGFSMFWKNDTAIRWFHQGFARDSWGATMIHGSHNATIEIWLDTGIIGTIAYFGMILISMRRTSDFSQAEYDFCSTFIVWETIFGLTERSYIPFCYQTMFLFLCMGYSCNRSIGKGDLP